MYAQVGKPKDNISRAVANSVDQKKSSEKQCFGFVDNRPESVVQRKMQIMANDSISHPVQRFTDPVTNNEVEIDEIEYLGTVLNYIEMLNRGTLELEKKERDALLLRRLRLIQTDNLKDKIADSNEGLMTEANQPGGVSYLHNVDVDTLKGMIEGGVDLNLGFADPRFFEQTGKFTWRLLPNISASAGIRAFLNPTQASDANPAVSIAECQTTMQAVFYHTILNMIGDKRFDKAFGMNGVEVPEEKRLLIEFQMSGRNPLNGFLADESATMDDEEMAGLESREEEILVDAPGFRPAKLGGWYFIKNHSLYNIRHSEGIWGGENALYVGVNDEGEQLFSGFGLENRTEEQMAEALAQEFNSPPTAAEVESVIRYRPQYLSLILHRLGDLSSLDRLPNLTQGTIDRLTLLWGQGGGPFANMPMNRRIFQIGALRALLKRAPLQPRISSDDLLAEIRLEDVDGGEVDPYRVHGNWDNTENAKRLTWTNALLRRISIRTLMDYYSNAFNMNLSHLLRDLIKRFNAELTLISERKMFDVRVGDVFLFPLPSTLTKLKKTPGGFQSLGSKVISPEKLQEAVKSL